MPIPFWRPSLSMAKKKGEITAVVGGPVIVMGGGGDEILCQLPVEQWERTESLPV
jgi:hypothetical protein